ncbi:2-polyprenyl-6-methoxyphenol hydroxylase [Paramicrobacterium humi]|uniref:2-polyprenyl-6-methoxyphenol hydroxylase n=1 Tax=Paramicrobacterium humi TaxID=640635 RepID=A0A1H4T312_9MICO|nr:NAD(P)/FAD-dependent oxidoreductase [Microbacterium humi]SEC50668.1 2-polyprenyl-6-methoxyphenol hydroxylase [Microbacterium humi]
MDQSVHRVWPYREVEVFTSRELEKQLAVLSESELRVLVVGAGIAGTTAAQLLRSSGIRPVLVDGTGPDANAGYMIALMPMVDAAIKQLGARGAYQDGSTRMDRYRVLSHRGTALRQDSLAALLAEYGQYRGLSRAALLDALSVGGCDVAWHTRVSSLAESGAGVAVTFETPDGGRAADFDVVIIADGIHSATRRFVPGGRSPQTTVTGWGGWVSWAPADAEPDLGEELWGDGFFVGSYPVKGAVGAFIGGPRADLADGPSAFVDRIRNALTASTPRLRRVLEAMDAAEDPFFWVLDDVRTDRWATGRTVLLGDAAAGFLPTAGIGAGMAIESAWVLCNTLTGAAPGGVAERLARYEAAQKPRVEAAQSNSRQLARLMFRRSTLLAHVRNTAMRFVSVDVALAPIRKLLDEPAVIPSAGVD